MSDPSSDDTSAPEANEPDGPKKLDRNTLYIVLGIGLILFLLIALNMN